MESTGRFTVDLRRLMAHSYDVCESCGATLPREIAAYAGYSADGSPLYVGGCCKHLIAELATHIYWWWEADKRCSADTHLWRYMDFAKFVAMLEQQAIYFARADFLGDPFEGASGIIERRPKWDAHYLEFFRQAISTGPGQTKPPSPEYIEREAARLLNDISKIAEMERKTHYVSCWHADTGESEALWRLYCPPPMTGVAIGTDAGRLIEALGDNSAIRLGRVQYIDFRTGFAGFYDRMYCKRRSLSHEAEVRAVIKDRHASENLFGMVMPVDLQRLLISVIPSPFAPSRFSTLIETTMRRFALPSVVAQSELLSQPFY